jgi:CHAD domain-containing protein
MRETIEREIKLIPPADFDSLDELGEPLEPRSFTTTYYDTSERALASAGVTLRRRLENGKNVWQLKVPGEGFRREIEVPGGPARPPRELSDALLGLVRDKTLEQAAKLKTTRSSVAVHDDGRGRAEIVLDNVKVMNGSRVESTFRELEVELVDGDAGLLRRLGKELRRRGALVSDGRPKLFHALGFALPPSPQAAPDAKPLLHVGALLERQRRQILAHDPGVRIGGDAEDVHRMRVAARRSRAVLRTARPLLARTVTDALREDLRWLAGELGAVRDLDVLLDHLGKQLTELPEEDRFAAERVLQVLSNERENVQAHLVEALESERYFDVLDRLAHVAAEPPASGREKNLGALAGRQFDRLRKAVADLPDNPSDEDLHGVRIRAKRARYAAELAQPEVGKPASRFVAAAKDLQDVLGEHQDAVVAQARIHEALASARGSRVAFAAGRLAERESRRRQRARAAFLRTWRRVERKGRRAWR